MHYVDVHDYASNDESYEQAVERMDRELARLLDILESAGLREHAVLFLTSDHGENLGEKHDKYLARSHIGNPSFQQLLEIPLIVTPPLVENPDRMLRSAGIGDLVRKAAGLAANPEGERFLRDDEVFLTEKRFLTYRRGRWKSAFHREKMGRWAMFDLENDPGETKNVISSEREVGAAQLTRVLELARELAAQDHSKRALSEDDRDRLRALGYLQQEELDLQQARDSHEQNANPPAAGAAGAAPAAESEN